MTPQFWLAEINRYGSAKLVDGPHVSRDGAEKARTLFSRLGFDSGKCLMIAEVLLTEPTGIHSEVNEQAIAALAKAGVG